MFFAVVGRRDADMRGVVLFSVALSAPTFVMVDVLFFQTCIIRCGIFKF